MFKNLKISVKLLLSTVVFIFPIGVLLYFVVYGFDKDIDIAKNEISGNKALGSVVAVTNDIIEYHNLITLQKSDTVTFYGNFGNESIGNISMKIDKSFIELINNCKIYKEKIHTVSQTESKYLHKIIEPEKLFEKWNLIKTKDLTSNAGINEDFTEIYDGSLALIRFIADESGLILDPDLDSYYLMDISALVLPKLQMQIGELMLIVQNSYTKGVVSEYDANKVRLLTEIIKFDYIDRINQGILTSIREDKNFYEESTTLRQNIPLHFDKFNQAVSLFADDLKKWYTGSESNDELLMQKLKINGYQALNSSAEFWEGVNAELDGLLVQRIAHYQKLRLVALLSSGFAFAFAVFLVLYVSKQIARHLRIVTDIAVDIADGRIDKAVSELMDDKRIGVFRSYTDDKIHVNDEIIILFRAIRKMTFNLSSLLLQVSKSGGQVSDTTFKITSSARDIEATVAEQAALTNEVNATSNEISKTAADLAKTMDFLTQTFHENSSMLKAGLEKLNEIKVNMNELFESSGEISQNLDLIKERASGINSVITTITKVANQTNLVSLNASIEAERAGAFGTGFAVVAREIRRLADQTAVAALDIEDMITEMQAAVSDGGDTIVRYMDKTKTGTEKTAQIIDQIGVLIDRSNELPKKIFVANKGMKQQSESAVQIHESMQQLNTAAIQTRNSLVDFNSATEKLNEAVKGLTDELQNFSLKNLKQED
ncbi:MAG: methyl-accepting chemotaxis protein [Candidatus Kapabacteria bacterium]|jgi:methyl-accepting chemotaxis protein WspA|nr:methyl-accepting chemotaxis protein [Candidatus Kapabacteria bacterium]